MAIVINSDNFESEVIQSKVPILVDFWAEWCGPCKALMPIIEEASTELDPTVSKIGKINVDDSPELAAKYNIMRVPTLILFKDGEPSQTLDNIRTKKEILDLLK